MIPKRPQRLSTKGAKFIARFEGLRTAPYDDPVGFATIGIGHLLHRSRVTLADRRRWRNFKATDAYALLQQDAEHFASELRRHGGWRLNQAQFDALLSFSFNVGTGWISDSGLQRALDRAHGRLGNKAKLDVTHELLKWDVAGGRHLEGLHRRRVAEAVLFSSGKYL